MSSTDWRFANATVIGTSHVKSGTPCQDHYRCRVFRHGADEREIALLSDGIEPLVLHYASRTVHGPFFDCMFGPVRRSQAIGEDLALSQDLEGYLSSPAILERTDDDKTLVLAMRRQQEVTGSQ